MDTVPLLPPSFNIEAAAKDITDKDWITFNRLTSVELTDQETILAKTPGLIAPEEKLLLAPHWHPEWIPLNLIQQRLKAAFPQAEDHFVVPTQHNRILTYGQYAGVEADVFAPSYGLKIQLLIHFEVKYLSRATVLTEMIDRTFRYRALLLLDILAQLTDTDESMAREIKKMGFEQNSLNLARFFAIRLETMIKEANIINTPRCEMLKNRLLTDFMQDRGQSYDPILMDRTTTLIKQVKYQVKRRQDPSRFYHAAELIEEARSLKAGIIIPHPPQFWPTLLDELDVDGWEVWNPSTPNHTIFLIECLARKQTKHRPLLAFMGDDTHMSSKIRPNIAEDKEGSLREIGFQPPWQNPEVALALKKAGQSREKSMSEYRQRIN